MPYGQILLCWKLLKLGHYVNPNTYTYIHTHTCTTHTHTHVFFTHAHKHIHIMCVRVCVLTAKGLRMCLYHFLATDQNINKHIAQIWRILTFITGITGVTFNISRRRISYSTFSMTILQVFGRSMMDSFPSSNCSFGIHSYVSWWCHFLPCESNRKIVYEIHQYKITNILNVLLCNGNWCES